LYTRRWGVVLLYEYAIQYTQYPSNLPDLPHL
jgi:hypothetical protein